VPSLRAAFVQIAELENSFRIRIGMWISMKEESDGSGYFEVHMSGSGDIYDHIPQPLGHTKARVIPAFDEPFASALFSCIDQLRSVLERYAGYLVLPPSH
jgi:hypothetical protein